MRIKSWLNAIELNRTGCRYDFRIPTGFFSGFLFPFRNCDGRIELGGERTHFNLSTFRGDAISLDRILFVLLWKIYATQRVEETFIQSILLLTSLEWPKLPLEVDGGFYYWKHISMPHSAVFGAKRICRSADASLLFVLLATWTDNGNCCSTLIMTLFAGQMMTLYLYITAWF